MDLSSTTKSTEIENYVSKLKKVFYLILNDEPDKRDDTINTKLIDALKRDISEENLVEKKILNEFLKLFLENEIINNDLKCSIFNLEIKESDIVKFFVDLVKIYITNNVNDQQFKNKLVQLIIKFLTEKCFILNEIDSCILCSLFDLINAIQNEAINDILLTEYNLNLFLNHNYKSIFVRNSFKEILKNHIIKKLDLHNSNISSIFSGLSINIKLTNLDVYSDVLAHFMFSSDTILIENKLLINQLISFHSSFSIHKNNFLDCIEELSSDYVIEAFVYNICFDLLLGSISKPSSLANDITNNQKKHLFFDRIFAKSLMEIISYSINLYYKLNNRTDIKNNSSISTQVSNFLFKFQFYFFSFICKFESFYKKNDILKIITQNFYGSIKDSLEILKSIILQTMTFPLKFTFNNTNSINITKNEKNIDQFKYDMEINDILLLLNDFFNFESKKKLLKHSAVNFKLSITKFNTENFDLFNFIDMNQFVYLLRHLNIDINVKHIILLILCEYFQNNHSKDHVQSFIEDIIIQKLSIKINDSYDEYLFKLAAICINQVQNFDSNQLIQLILLDDQNNNFLFLINFLTIILEKIQESLKGLYFVVELLDCNNCIILNRCVNLIQEDYETEHDLKDSIFNFFRSLFSCFNSKIISYSNIKDIQINSNNFISFYNFENLIFTCEFFTNLEAYCLIEAEAFLRREMIRFLKSFHFYKFKLWLLYLYRNQKESTKISSLLVIKMNKYIWNFINYFSYCLVNDFDWQIQLYCIELFQAIFESMFEFLEMCSYEFNIGSLIDNSFLNEFSKMSFVETICCLSPLFKSVIKCLNDYDQFVRSQSANLLFMIKSNFRFISILTEFDKKHNQLFQKEFKSTHLDSLITKIQQSDIHIKGGAKFNCIETVDKYRIHKHNDDEDDDNYLKKFLNFIQIEDLKLKLNDSNNDSYLYKNNIISIIDDIINSYKFDLDDEKAVDCY